MKRIFVLAVATSIITAGAGAQANVKSNYKLWDHFHSFNTLQLLNGSSTTTFAINTVNGFQVGNFFAGAGTGFDYYYHISVPLFIEARFDLVKRKGKLQLFGNGGVSIPFSSQNRNFETKTGEYKNGSLYNAGLDYLVTGKGGAFIIGAAFSNKQIIQMVDNVIWNPVTNMSENVPIKDKYNLNRIAIRLGWMF